MKIRYRAPLPPLLDRIFVMAVKRVAAPAGRMGEHAPGRIGEVVHGALGGNGAKLEGFIV